MLLLKRSEQRRSGFYELTQYIHFVFIVRLELFHSHAMN